MIDENQTLTRRFGVRFALPAAVILLGIIVAVALGLRYAAFDIDKMSSEGQTYQAYLAIGRSMDDIAATQQTVATCAYCVETVTSGKPDAAWLDANVALRLHDMETVAETYIVDEKDRPVYAAHGRRRAPTSAMSGIRPTLQPFFDRVRAKVTAPNNFSERLPGQPLAQFNTVRTTPDAVHSTDLAQVRGRPAIVSVMRMIPGDAPGTAARSPLIVSIRYMDAGYLRELSQRNFLSKTRISATDKTAPGERSAEIASFHGTRLGYLIWRPILPGNLLVGSLLPWSLGAIALLGTLLVGMGGGIWYLMRRDLEHMERLESAQIDLKASEAQAHHLAYHDVLTGLPNRAQFTGVADLELAKVRNGMKAAVLLLDLDRFKVVNDRFGHLAGDQLIEEVARRLMAIAGEDNLVARLGGDEFAILVKEPFAVRHVEKMIDRILHDLREPFDVIGNQAFIGVSIGVAIAPECGRDRSELLRKADIALYRAKELGRDGCCFFTESMDDTIQLRAALEADLRDAIEKGGQLHVHYQPQMDSRDGRVVGLEALVRWEHPLRGIIGPDVFVPIAEETGLVQELGDWVLREACRVAAIWPELSIAVNLSPIQFREEGFADHVERIVRAAGVKPRQIELEVTEGVLLDDDDIVRASVKGLRRKGFRIALDDFGTGYSSLSYLRSFEVDKIKIDKSFVKHLGETHDAAAIITAVITLGHAMGLRVTAEGVETGDQSAFLAAAGCNELQGFLFSHAIPEQELATLLAQPPVRRATVA